MKKSSTKKSTKSSMKKSTKKKKGASSSGSRGSERRSERSTKTLRSLLVPRRQDHYFMAALPEVMVEAFRDGLHRALEGKLGEVVFVDVTKDWSPDTSAEVFATLSADIRPYTDMDAVMTDAAELVRKTAVKVFEGALVMPAVPSPTAPAPEPKTYPVVLDRKQLRKEPGCIFVDVREITFRSEFQIELYLSTNSAKKKWKDEDEDEGEE